MADAAEADSGAAVLEGADQALAAEALADAAAAQEAALAVREADSEEGAAQEEAAARAADFVGVPAHLARGAAREILGEGINKSNYLNSISELEVR